MQVKTKTRVELQLNVFCAYLECVYYAIALELHASAITHAYKVIDRLNMQGTHTVLGSITLQYKKHNAHVHLCDVRNENARLEKRLQVARRYYSECAQNVLAIVEFK